MGGAVIGVGLLFGLLFLVTGKVEELLGDSHEYKGWWMFFFCTLGLPIALCMGYMFRNCAKHALMAATAFGGASLALSSFESLLVCSEVDLQPISEPIVQQIIMAIVGITGFLVQWYSGRVVEQDNKHVASSSDGP